MENLKKVEAELEKIGILTNCPWCNERLYIPLEEISKEGLSRGIKEFQYDSCKKNF